MYHAFTEVINTMARTIVITSKHGLGAERVKAQITERFAALKAGAIDRIGAAELSWHGDTGHAYATALGAKGTAILTVGDGDLRIEITLPLLLAPLGGFVESLIRGNADALHPA